MIPTAVFFGLRNNVVILRSHGVRCTHRTISLRVASEVFVFQPGT